MKKLIFVFAVMLSGIGFIACEQEKVQPAEELELNETTDPGNGDDEEDGDRPAKSG